MSWHTLSVEQQPDGRIFIVVSSRATDLSWVIDGLPEVLPSDVSVEDLGAAVVRGLRRSSIGRITRKDPPDAELLAWVGAPDYTTYSRGVHAVDVIADFDETISSVEVTPQARHRGGGFTSIPDATVVIDGSDLAAVGTAIRDALARATT